MDPTPPVRMLVVEDDRALLDVLTDELRERGHTVSAAATLAAAGDLLASGDFEVALLDLMLPDGSGIEVLRRIAAEGRPTEVIVLTGYASVDTAVEAMKLGAYDYVTKPARMDELEVLVRRAAEKARLRRENEALKAQLHERDGVSAPISADPANAVPAATPAGGETIDAEHLVPDARDPSPETAAARVRMTLAEVEREHIEAVLRVNGGHRGRTARALGIDPKTLYNKLGPERPRRKD